MQFSNKTVSCRECFGRMLSADSKLFRSIHLPSGNEDGRVLLTLTRHSHDCLCYERLSQPVCR